MMRVAFQEVLEAEMAEALWAAKSERTGGAAGLSIGLLRTGSEHAGRDD